LFLSSKRFFVAFVPFVVRFFCPDIKLNDYYSRLYKFHQRNIRLLSTDGQIKKLYTLTDERMLDRRVQLDL